ncbi:bifunctional ornithine acetyltransferase/N-acetylglutamate synthase, partial [bacterium]|nr:bifunctional ornithine acetyltransferase/N-acetylglutamate synthase [bacterium]
IANSSLNSIKDAISQVAISLAKQIAGDGEGAEHLLEVRVLGVSSERAARSVLRGILTSSLVKTAVHGRDPNWGRILMAAGNSLLMENLPDNHPISISIQSVPVFNKGEPVPFHKTSLSQKMGEFEVLIEVNFHDGENSITGWGCDFSEKYVAINAEYST